MRSLKVEISASGQADSTRPVGVVIDLLYSVIDWLEMYDWLAANLSTQLPLTRNFRASTYGTLSLEIREETAKNT